MYSDTIWQFKFLNILFSNIIYTIPNNNKKIIYLTFDDGPSEKGTKLILSILDNFDAKATFFLTGHQVTKFPNLIEEIYTKGHVIGNHGNSHINGWSTSTKAYLKDVEDATLSIINLTNFKIDLFRPAYGKMTINQLCNLNKFYKIVFWSILAKDWLHDFNYIDFTNQYKVVAKSGDILVLHDNYKSFNKIKNLDFFLYTFTTLGYEFRTL